MKRTFLAAALAIIILAVAGCGDNNPPPTFVSQVLSDPALDGDIARDPVSGAFTVTEGMSPTVQSVFAGFDPATGDEFRAFLDFPLTGAGGVPGNATIVSAVLDIFIDSIQPVTGTIPVRIDLVSFPSVPPTLSGADFNSTFLATLSTSIFQSDLGNHVLLDVTPLMNEAQLLGLANFQIRILVPVPPGLIEINDTTGANRADLAPLLQVTYF